MALYDEILREANRAGRAATQMGSEIASDPLAYAGTVVPPLDYRTAYNPAGGYAEAGRTVPNYASDWARGMNQVAQPFGGMGAGDRVGFPAPRDPQTGEDLGWMNQDERERFYRHQEQFPEGEDLGWMETSVVAPPRMPTEKETLDRGVMGPANERDAAFSKIHDAYYTGADFGYEQGWPERLGVPTEYIDLYMAVPDGAKQYAYDNPTDAILQQFEEKYGFPLDVSIEISM